MSTAPTVDPQAPTGLGLDAGGTRTRWALADAAGAVVAQGSTAGLTALQMAQPEGAAAFAAVLADIAVQAQRHGRIAAVCAGLTGFDGDAPEALAALFSQAFSLPSQAVLLSADVELACRAAFAPGQGFLVYGGTGSVAAFVDEHGQLHRAGGRGGLIDDGGSGYWIAREALCQVWRAEDQQPGAWRGSALAQRLFDAVGGTEWADTRRWVYSASRGQLGGLAMNVAAAADTDPAALAILASAGRELARLALALAGRFGAHPVGLSGRVFELHPVIEYSLRAALPGWEVRKSVDLAAHLAAARLALGVLAPRRS